MTSEHPFSPEDFSLAAEEAVHEICRGFETALRRGESPSIETQLAKVDASLRPLAIYELVKLDAESQRRRAREPQCDDYRALVDRPEAASAVVAALSDCRQHLAEVTPGAVANAQDAQTPPVDATKPPSTLPEKLGRYLIKKRLGQGGMGVVFKAFDPRLQRFVALKVPHYDRSSDERIRERFRREALALASLRHDMIVPVYDVERDGDYEFLTMALVEGEPLRRYVQPQRPLSQRHAAVLVRSLAKAMQYVHDRGVIHRDLKPENIILEGGQKPVIVDFGLARAPAATDAPAPSALRNLGKSLTRFGLVAGTPDYSSPEQLAGDFEAVGPQSDVYSLGVILFELLTGSLPPERNEQGLKDDSTGREKAVLASDLNGQVDPHLARICAQAIDPLPAHRHQSMDKFAEALKPFCTAHAVHHRLAVEGEASGNENVDAALVLQEITRQAEPRFTRPVERRRSPVRLRTLAYGVGGLAAVAVLAMLGSRSHPEDRTAPEAAQRGVPRTAPAALTSRPSRRSGAAMPAREPGDVREDAPDAEFFAGAFGQDEAASTPPAWDPSIRRLVASGAVLTFQLPAASGRSRITAVRSVGTLPQRPNCFIIGFQLTAAPVDAKLRSDMREVLHRDRQKIRKLELRKVTLDERTFEVIGQLTNLEQLTLSETNLQDRDVPVLRGLKQLRHADLSATDLSDAALGDLIEACNNLERLRSIDLRRTKISQATARALEAELEGREAAAKVIFQKQLQDVDTP